VIILTKTVIKNKMETTTMCPHHAAKLAAEKLINLTNATVAKVIDHAAMGHDMSHMDHSTMDHSTMDHSGHNMGDMGGHGMVMTFHGGYKEAILFDFWKTSSIAGFLVSCFVLFLCAALYEGLKLGREKLIAYELKKQANSPVILNGGQSFVSRNCHCKPDEKSSMLNPEEGRASHDCCNTKNDTQNREHLINQTENIVIKSFSSKLLSSGHLIQTLLHMVQITVSYLLMLVFMTYNSWLCLAVVLGAGAGYFIFGVYRMTSIDVNEHCH